METISYKCPNCGGDLRFHPEKQDYLCEFCDSRFSQKELEAMTPQDGDEDADCYICPSCGAEIVTEPTTTATFCYYCHNPVVVSQRLKGTYHPDRIIPFAIDRKKALEIFGQWIGTKKYVPRDFYSSDQVEKLTGVYFPYWLYGCQVKASVDARGDKVSTWAAGNIRYTKTDQYDVSRQGTMEVANVPRNALSKANRRLVEGVFPFDMEKQKEFHMGYLSGFFAENRDMESGKFVQEVEQEVEAYARQSLTGQIGDYSSVQVRSCQARLEKPSWKYTLLPVWTLTYKDKRNGRIYYFACNGQSGKICGELPVDRGRLGRLFASIFLPVAAVLLAVGYMIG
ncbi:MAG: TFIIB-type zinc ribbon-containing protein [Lachnospiraceae bacterium]|jgi:DNA-directed RNA polymerase subunit RPC12/RpoP|nr:TFIIB-type zinc ribbon-containing protein [Lachnospiraceae bacterium]